MTDEQIAALKEEIEKLKRQSAENQRKVDAAVTRLENAMYDIRFGPYHNAGPTVRALLRGLEIDIEDARKRLGDTQWQHE